MQEVGNAVTVRGAYKKYGSDVVLLGLDLTVGDGTINSTWSVQKLGSDVVLLGLDLTVGDSTINSTWSVQKVRVRCLVTRVRSHRGGQHHEVVNAVTVRGAYKKYGSDVVLLGLDLTVGDGTINSTWSVQKVGSDVVLLGLDLTVGDSTM
ncbi:hypothetical protein J6590_107697 [Homalodisca vitripennis]|nr:hypothetical protein J6590_107697 [Homalodisca vitripennis]